MANVWQRGEKNRSHSCCCRVFVCVLCCPLCVLACLPACVRVDDLCFGHRGCPRKEERVVGVGAAFLCHLDQSVVSGVVGLCLPSTSLSVCPQRLSLPASKVPLGLPLTSLSVYVPLCSSVWIAVPRSSRSGRALVRQSGGKGRAKDGPRHFLC